MPLSLAQTLSLAWVGTAILADVIVAFAIFRHVHTPGATVRLAQAILPGYIEQVHLRACRETGATPSKLVAARRVTTGNLFLSMVVAIPVLLMPPPSPPESDGPAPAAVDEPASPPAAPPAIRPASGG